MSHHLEELLQRKKDLPEPLAGFLHSAIARLRADDRVVGVAVGGSFLSGSMDEYSDLDLVIAVEPARVDSIMADRHDIAAALGPLLAAFTGEHVGEPRVLICLFGPPLIHVDLKFMSLTDVADRVETPVVLWQRGTCMSTAMQGTEAECPAPDLQWIEDRFWVWVHYGAGKIGRGEILEAHDLLAFLRARVLGPLALADSDARPCGVRKLESEAPRYLPELRNTIAAYDQGSCLEALETAANLYRKLRAGPTINRIQRRSDAERAVMEYLDTIRAQIASRDTTGAAAR